MGIRAFTEAVQARMVVIMDKAGAKVPEFGLGWKSTLMERGPLPRIVWVPRGGPTKGDAIDGDDVSTPRKLAMRQPTLDAHIWGEDIDDCEQLANFMIGALQDMAWGSYNLKGELWDAGTDAEFTVDGQLFVVSVEVRLPWTRQKTAAVDAPIELAVSPSATMGGA